MGTVQDGVNVDVLRSPDSYPSKMMDQNLDHMEENIDDRPMLQTVILFHLVCIDLLAMNHLNFPLHFVPFHGSTYI